MSHSSDDCESNKSSNLSDSSEDSSESSEDGSESSESSDLSNSDDSSNDSENSSNDENNESTWNWNYNIPRKILKSFNDKSNTLHQHNFKLRPIDCFMLLFTEQLFELIWRQTNIYGQQNRKNWTSINIIEIKKWIAINILMGYHKLPSYTNYWSTYVNFNVPIVRETMSRNLFSKILNNIHLADNKKNATKSIKKIFKDIQS
jgi:hypothetical protein